MYTLTDRVSGMQWMPSGMYILTARSLLASVQQSSQLSRVMAPQESRLHHVRRCLADGPILLTNMQPRGTEVI